jgi:hypothetical protein
VWMLKHSSRTNSNIEADKVQDKVADRDQVEVDNSRFSSSVKQ